MSNKQLASNDNKREALLLAQATIKHTEKNIYYRDLSSLHNFIHKLSAGETRNKVTLEECERIVNIAKKYT